MVNKCYARFEVVEIPEKKTEKKVRRIYSGWWKLILHTQQQRENYSTKSGTNLKF